jgi:hypothetical protein
MDSKLIEEINELLIAGRSQLKKEPATVTRNKLSEMREKLKENFILNLPSNYNNERELFDLFNRIEVIRKSLKDLKIENNQVINDHLKANNNKQNNNNDDDEEEEQLDTAIYESIRLKRQLCYTSCLIKIEELK